VQDFVEASKGRAVRGCMSVFAATRRCTANPRDPADPPGFVLNFLNLMEVYLQRRCPERIPRGIQNKVVHHLDLDSLFPSIR
jgi:hypothetical protein